MDVRTDAFDGPYDGVLALAVLLHLTPRQLRHALCRLRGAVRDGGVLAFSVKEGDGSEWSTAKIGLPRYFTYWCEPDLRALLSDTGWAVRSFEHIAGPADDWLYVIAH